MGTLTEDWWVPVGRGGVRGGCKDLQKNEKTNYQVQTRQHPRMAPGRTYFWHDSLWQESTWSHDLPLGISVIFVSIVFWAQRHQLRTQCWRQRDDCYHLVNFWGLSGHSMHVRYAPSFLRLVCTPFKRAPVDCNSCGNLPCACPHSEPRSLCHLLDSFVGNLIWIITSIQDLSFQHQIRMGMPIPAKSIATSISFSDS